MCHFRLPNSPLPVCVQVKEQEAASLLVESRSAHAKLANAEQQLQDVSQVAATLQGELHHYPSDSISSYLQGIMI